MRRLSTLALVLMLGVLRCAQRNLQGIGYGAAFADRHQIQHGKHGKTRG